MKSILTITVALISLSAFTLNAETAPAKTAESAKPVPPTPSEAPAKPAAPAVVDPLKAPADVAQPPKDAIKTASGLASKVLAPGSGAIHPRATDSVTVHYSGWYTNGNLFDSSHKRGQPATFGLNQVIAGWTEGLQLMVEGEKRRLWIPENLAYKGQPGRPAGMLVFDVELIRINK
ncbi:MAG: FKBP-type peptidyl-prolyl cis-trans isomerase [Verrucomicrobiota bacterium]|nr:FKBP-type peptidyl-prolyl cis-trans isomerase [Verrucomicrobiota bacterium]